ALVAALDTRDHLARGHSSRVVGYALAIGNKLRLSQEELRDLAFGGYLHDLGKISLDDSLLRKETSLSDGEWDEMRRHPLIGHEILREMDFLGGASEVVLYHHERYDGQGYPAGISGEDIPLLARIFAVADAFDAMTADRPYRPAGTFAQAREAITGQSGKQFCPKCVRAFLSLTDSELERVRTATGEGWRADLRLGTI
ncbi:MAG: HD-GYP domain-containing protein, partial [Patescibacteria group bacterium]